MGISEEFSPIYGSRQWEVLSRAERDELGLHLSSWLFSQFLHGEQGALTVAARIVESVPDMDSKFYAATQAMDEARHVELFSRFVRDKIGLHYPVNADLGRLLADALGDSRWDLPYLGMQVLIEGLALAAFGVHRDMATNPLVQADPRLRDAGRGPARGVRPARAARLLLRADRGRAGRPRGVRGRGLLPHAQPFPCPGGVGADGVRRRRVPGVHRELPDAAGVPRAAVQPDRAVREGHRAVGRGRPAGLRRPGGPRRRPDRPRRADARRRADRRGGGPAQVRGRARRPARRGGRRHGRRRRCCQPPRLPSRERLPPAALPRQLHLGGGHLRVPDRGRHGRGRPG